MKAARHAVHCWLTDSLGREDLSRSAETDEIRSSPLVTLWPRYPSPPVEMDEASGTQWDLLSIADEHELSSRRDFADANGAHAV